MTQINDNTTKLQSILETVNTLPESGSESGNNNAGEWIYVNSLPTTLANTPIISENPTYYLELDSNVIAILLYYFRSNTIANTSRGYISLFRSNTDCSFDADDDIISTASSSGYMSGYTTEQIEPAIVGLTINSSYEWYALPVYGYSES